MVCTRSFRVIVEELLVQLDFFLASDFLLPDPKGNLMCSIYIDKNGYVRFRDSGRLLHRWAAEKELGRKLKPWEVVHHINRDKLDNRPHNLYVCRNQWHHDLMHLIDAERYGWEVSLYGFGYREFVKHSLEGQS